MRRIIMLALVALALVAGEASACGRGGGRRCGGRHARHSCGGFAVSVEVQGFYGGCAGGRCR